MTTETPMLTSDMKEVVDRCRRMETRLTRFLEAQGFDTQVKRATWRADGTVLVPSPSVSLKEVLLTIPSTWPADKSVRIEHKGELLLWGMLP